MTKLETPEGKLIGEGIEKILRKYVFEPIDPNTIKSATQDVAQLRKNMKIKLFNADVWENYGRLHITVQFRREHEENCRYILSYLKGNTISINESKPNVRVVSKR